MGKETFQNSEGHGKIDVVGRASNTQDTVAISNKNFQDVQIFPMLSQVPAKFYALNDGNGTQPAPGYFMNI